MPRRPHIPIPSVSRTPSQIPGQNTALQALVTGQPKDQDPRDQDPRDKIPVGHVARSPMAVVRGLGLGAEAEAVLSERVQAWMDAPDHIQARKMMMQDLRGAFPGNDAESAEKRREAGRRAAGLLGSEGRKIPRLPTIKKGMTMDYEALVGRGQDLIKAGPPGGGWEPVPKGHKAGGMKKRQGGGWIYWYPGQGVTVRPQAAEPAKKKREQPAPKKGRGKGGQPDISHMRQAKEMAAKLKAKGKDQAAGHVERVAKMTEEQGHKANYVSRLKHVMGQYADEGGDPDKQSQSALAGDTSASTGKDKGKSGTEAPQDAKDSQAAGEDNPGKAQLRDMMAQAIKQFGKDAVMEAAHDVAGQVAQHVDQEMQARAAGVASSPAVQRVVKEQLGDNPKGATTAQAGRVARAMRKDEACQAIAMRELHQMAPGITEATVDAVADAAEGVEKSKDSGSKVKAVARAILKGAAGSFVFGFVDNFMLYMAGASIDQHVAAMGATTAVTAGLGNAVSGVVGQSGAKGIENILDRYGLGKNATDGVLSEKTEGRIRSAASVGGVFAGAIAGMVPLLFGVSFGKGMQRPKIGLRLRKGGPYIGPRGGKWADAAHTIPWTIEHQGAHEDQQARITLERSDRHAVNATKRVAEKSKWTGYADENGAHFSANGDSVRVFKSGRHWVAEINGNTQTFARIAGALKTVGRHISKNPASRVDRPSKLTHAHKITGNLKEAQDMGRVVIGSSGLAFVRGTGKYDVNHGYMHLSGSNGIGAVKTFRTKVQASAAAKRIGWSLDSLTKVHTRLSSGWALQDTIQTGGQHAALSAASYDHLASGRKGTVKKSMKQPTLVAILEVMEKGAAHKYLQRVPTGKVKPKFRYIYDYPTRRKLTEEDHLVEGAKIKVEHAGKDGHFEVEHHDREKGVVRLKHDESGKIAHIKTSDLHAMVQAHHKRKGTAEATKARKKAKAEARKRAQRKAKKAAAKPPRAKKKEGPPQEPLKLRHPAQQKEMEERIKAIPDRVDQQPAPASPVKKSPAPELPVADMSDIGKAWDEVEEFAPSRADAELIAHQRGGEGKEYATVKQPMGYVLVSRKKHERNASGEAVGSKTDVWIRDTGGKDITALDGEYVLMESAKVIPSHTLGGMAPREDYPENVQERRYHEMPGEQQKIARIAANLKPAFLANTNPDAVNGAPIVTEDGIVLGGNGRTMGMQLAYASHPESVAKMREYLEANARAFGISPAEVRGMKQPILVRRVKAGTDTDHLRKLGRRMNQNLTQGMDPRTIEVANAKNFVDDSLMDVLVDSMGSSQSLSEYLQSGDSIKFIRALERSGILDNQNKEEFVIPVDPDKPDPSAGLLNEDGRMMVERTLAAKFLPDPLMLTKMNQSVRRNIASSVPYLLRARRAGWDLTESMMTASGGELAYRRAKEAAAKESPPSKLSPGDWMKRQMLGGIDDDSPEARMKKDPVASMIMQVMLNHNGSQKTPRGFREFARRAEQAERDRGENQGNMFGGGPEPETPDKAMDNAFGITAEGKKSVAARKAAAEASMVEYAKAMGVTLDEAKKMAKKQKEEQAAAEKKMKAEAKKKAKGGGSKNVEAAEGGGLFAMSMADWPMDLVKGMSPDKGEDAPQGRAAAHLPRYAMNAILGELKHMIRARTSTAALTGEPLTVSGSDIKERLMDWLFNALQRDPDLARAFGAQPLDHDVLDGLIEVLVEQHQGQLTKAMAKWWGPLPTMLCKGVAVAKGGQRPPGAGWSPIPHSSKGGFRKMGPGGWIYWYANQGVHAVENQIGSSGIKKTPVPPEKWDKKRAAHEAEAVVHMDDVHRGLVVAERVNRTNAGAAQHPKYGPVLANLPGQIERIQASIRNARDIHKIHDLQERARKLANVAFEVARGYETKQTGLFGEEDTSLPKRKEMTAGEVEQFSERAAQRYVKGGGKERDPYLATLRERHGPAEVEKVFHRSQELVAQKRANRGKGGKAPKLYIGRGGVQGSLFATPEAPAKPKQKSRPAKPKAKQESLFSQNEMLGDGPGQRTLF